MGFFRIAYNKAIYSQSIIVPIDLDSNLLCKILEPTNGNIELTAGSADRDYIKIGEF